MSFSSSIVDSQPQVVEHELQSNNRINPFYHRVNSSLYQNLKVGIFFIPAFIFRFIPMLGCLFMAWVFALFGTIGMSMEQIQSRPLSHWRKMFRWIFTRIWMRGIFFFAGFYFVKIKGQRASRNEAPILVVAPHSSLADVLVLVLLGAPSVVSKASIEKVPFIRTLVNFLQPIYVSREDISSRSNAMEAIEKRSKSSMDWPQIYIYPEGTTTNRSSLIHFKTGAFNPGVPVQPLIIKYPNWNDTITWTFDGMSMIEMLSRCLTQVYLKCEIEFLPVYFPNDVEKQNGDLFARNVRHYMTRRLGIPITSYRITDGLIIGEIKSIKPGLITKLRKLYEFREQTNISFEFELNLIKKIELERKQIKITLNEFRRNFTTVQNPALIQQIFQMFDPMMTGEIDIRQYLIYVLVLNSNVEIIILVKVIFKLYCATSILPISTFLQIVASIYEMPIENVEKYFKFDSPTMGENEFYTKIHKSIEYLRLCALESKRMISVYPPRDFELKQ